MHDGVEFDDGDRRLAAVTPFDPGPEWPPGDDGRRGTGEGAAARLQDTAMSPVVPGGHDGGSARSGGGTGELGQRRMGRERGKMEPARRGRD